MNECSICSKPFKPSRATKKYCSEVCRQVAAQRSDQKYKQKKKQLAESATNATEVLRVIEEIRGNGVSKYDSITPEQFRVADIPAVQTASGTMMRYTANNGSYTAEIVGKRTVSEWFQWYHAARNEQNKLEIYVLVAKSPAFIYAPVLHASQTTTAFLEMFCLDQYKQEGEEYDIILAPPWCHAIVFPPSYRPKLSLFFAINNSFTFYTWPKQAIMDQAANENHQEASDIGKCNLQKTSQYFEYQLDRLNRWHVPYKHVKASEWHLKRNQVLVVRPGHVVSFQTRKGLETTVEPFVLIRGHGYYVGDRPKEFIENVQLMEEAEDKNNIAKIELLLHKVLTQAHLLSSKAHQLRALQALPLVKYYMQTKRVKYQELPDYKTMVAAVTTAETFFSQIDPIQTITIGSTQTERIESSAVILRRYFLYLKATNKHLSTCFVDPLVVQTHEDWTINLFEYQWLVVPVIDTDTDCWKLAIVSNPNNVLLGANGACNVFVFNSDMNITDCIADLLKWNASTFNLNLDLQRFIVCPISTIEMDPRCSLVFILHAIDTFFDTPQELNYAQQAARDIWKSPLDVVKKHNEVLSKLQNEFKIECKRRVEDKGHPLYKYNIYRTDEPNASNNPQASSAALIDEHVSKMEYDTSFFILPAHYTDLLLALDPDLMLRLDLRCVKYLLLPLFKEGFWRLTIVANPYSSTTCNTTPRCSIFTNDPDTLGCTNLIRNLLRPLAYSLEKIDVDNARTWLLPASYATVEESAKYLVNCILLFLRNPFQTLEEYQIEQASWMNLNSSQIDEPTAKIAKKRKLNLPNAPSSKKARLATLEVPAPKQKGHETDEEPSESSLHDT